MNRRRVGARRLRALALAALSAGCAEKPPPEVRVRDDLTRGRWEQAAEAAADQGDELLRHLDRGLALLYAGDTRGSNLHLARAEQVAEERYTRSLSRAALSLVLNETVLPYQPDPIERLLVPLYRALNHVAVGESADAAVEARRLSTMLLARRDEAGAAWASEGGAFLAAAAGAVLEWSGRGAEATVAYRLALDADPASRVWLPSRAPLATPDPALQAPPFTEGATISRVIGAGEDAPADGGELVIVVETGFVATPVEEHLFLVLYSDDLELAHRDPDALGDELAKRYLARHARDFDDDDLAYLLPIAIPRRPAPTEHRARATAWVDGEPAALSPALDVSASAAAAYDRAFAGMLAKTAARAVAKTLLFREALEDEDEVVRILSNALHVATERADTRAWASLPDEVFALRLSVEPGDHAVTVDVEDAGGRRSIELGTAHVVPGGIAILHARAFAGPAGDAPR